VTAVKAAAAAANFDISAEDLGKETYPLYLLTMVLIVVRRLISTAEDLGRETYPLYVTYPLGSFRPFEDPPFMEDPSRISEP
jgi:hypothetical protein